MHNKMGQQKQQKFTFPFTFLITKHSDKLLSNIISRYHIYISVIASRNTQSIFADSLKIDHLLVFVVATVHQVCMYTCLCVSHDDSILFPYNKFVKSANFIMDICLQERITFKLEILSKCRKQ